MTYRERILKASGWKGRGFDLFIGALAVLGHAPFHFWPLTLICFAVCMCRLDSARPMGKRGLSRGFWFGFGYFLAGTFWIGSAFIVRGPAFIPAMPPMILGLAMLLAFFWALAGYVYVRYFGTSHWRWWGLALLLWGAEFARGHVFGGLPWNLPGYIFEAGGAMSQSTALIGIYGLSLIVMIISAYLAQIVMRENRLVSSLCASVLFVVPVGFGMMRLSDTTLDYVDDVTLRVVQVPFSQKDKFERDASIKIVNEFIQTSLEPGIKDVTHLVWPEGAVLGLVLQNRSLIEAMGTALTKEDPSPPYWILNTLRQERRPDDTSKSDYYNSSAVIGFGSDGIARLEAINDKHRLVPFGEFIPGGEIMERLGSMTVSTSLASITPAPVKTLADYPGLPKVGPQICYEIIFSNLTPRPKDSLRAEWILNQSNDAWYGQSSGPAQHANMAAYRAIEEGLPIIRSASNGVSGLIDPYGRYVQKLAPQEKGVIDIRLPQPVSVPRMPRWRDWALLLINMCLAIILAVCSRRGNTSK